MWNEVVFIQTKDEQLHPYMEWCGCNTLDFPAMEKILGLTHIRCGTEIVYKEVDLPIIPPTPVASATGNKGKRMDPIKMVQRLQELGVISDQTKETLIKYKDKVDEQIEIANSDLQSFSCGDQTILCLRPKGQQHRFRP
jgi:hypothetical protein